MVDYNEILNCKMQDNDANALTIRDYLYKLLFKLWMEGEGFSSKRPFGNSYWESDLYTALVLNGYVDGVVEPECTHADDVDILKANKLIFDCIEYMCYGKLKGETNETN